MSATAEQLDPGFARFSGMLVLDQRKAAVELYGQRIVERAIEAMSPGARDEYEAMTPFSWCANTTLTEFTTCMMRETGYTREQLTREIVTRGTQKTFGSVWRILLRLQSPQALLRRVATMRKKSCDRGEMHAERLEPGHVLLRLTDWPGIPDSNAIGFAAGIETIMRLAGRRDPKVQWAHKNGEVHFHVWFDYEASNIQED